MKTNKKIMAVFMVLAMLMMSIIPMIGTTDSDATSGDGGAYSYTMIYDSSVMETGTNSISVDGMTAIYHPSYNVLSVTDDNDGTTGYGSWTWDMETGVGPFNSFYAAFDADNGNRMTARLNPFDLTKTIDGYDLPTGHKYNIMWVLPTVYWKIGEVTVEVPGDNDTTEEVTYPTLTLTNDANAGGIAYAHTINGHTYNYIAIGVYEGYVDTITVDDSSVTVLTSQTGKNPSNNINRNTFRDYANNYEMDSYLGDNAYSMQWNFYQWELYKYCALTLMEDFNSQATVGNGKVYTSDNNVRYNATGLMDQSGPYAGTIGDVTNNANDGDSVKLFIENAWGSLADFVDGVVFNYTELYSNSDPESATTVDVYIQTTDTPDNYYGGDVGTDSYVDVIELSSRYTPSDAKSEPKSETKTQPKSETKTLDEELDPEDPSLTGSGYPLDIITNDARIWGFGDVPGGSASTGLSDYEWLPNSTGPKSVYVGGTSDTNSSSWPQYGLSAASSNYALDYRFVYIGSRLAFVFDVDATSTERTVTFNNYQYGYGTIKDGDETVTSTTVPNGSVITVDDDEMTIGYKTFVATPTTATAQYTYAFTEWTKESGYVVNNDISVGAHYSRTVNQYTITWDVDGTTDTTTVPYGQTPTHDIPTKDNYRFAGWSPKPVQVTGNATYTATWTPITYTVTWDPTGGYVSPKTSTGSVETAISSYPTPTRDNYTFVGWFTQSEDGSQIAASIYPSANVTYYAHWTAITYTVTYNGNTGSTGVASATGSQTSPIALTTATLSQKYFAGWYDAATGGKLVGLNGTLFYPVENVTLYAHWSDEPVYTYSLNLNGNGSTVTPKSVINMGDENEPYTFTVPKDKPYRAGMYFLGWATTSEATEVEYESGDRIEVNANSTVTLYAVWSDEPAPTGYEWLGQIIPVLVIVGLLLAATMIFIRARAMSTTEMVASIVGIVVAIIVVAALLLPMSGMI